MKNVLVTGATGTIGEAMAVKLAQSGYNTALHTNSKPEQAQKLAKVLSETYGVKTAYVQADLTVEAEADEMFRTLDKTFGGIDILVNNAGISSVMMLCDTSEKEWDRVHDINLKSAFLCSKKASEHMVHNKWGRIINISSVWGQVGASCEVAYSSSKAALIGFTKALAKELAPSGITVNCVCPGIIDTKMNSHLSQDELRAICEEIPAGRMGKPNEVAHAVAFLAHEDAAYITGETLSVNGGWFC